MNNHRASLLSFVFALFSSLCLAQPNDSLQRISAIVFDETVIPLPFTHIINLETGRGTISDTTGRFSLNVYKSDSVLFRNVSCRELKIAAREIFPGDTIRLQVKLFELKEVKIFEWGSSYADFRNKFLCLPPQENMGKKLNLPRQKSNPISDFRNKEVLSNPFFALTNPIDFLYYNLSKSEQSIRKVMELKKDEDLVRKFESVYNKERVASITKLSGAELENFMIYLNIHFRCDFNCNEIQIINEIFMHWKNYKSMNIKRLKYLKSAGAKP